MPGSVNEILRAQARGPERLGYFFHFTTVHRNENSHIYLLHPRNRRQLLDASGMLHDHAYSNPYIMAILELLRN